MGHGVAPRLLGTVAAGFVVPGFVVPGPSFGQIHLPAMNPPQFGWCRAKMPTHPMPARPIYQPECCAVAVADLVESGRRQKISGVWNWLLVRLLEHPVDGRPDVGARLREIAAQRR